jgi:hypothetical protein
MDMSNQSMRWLIPLQVCVALGFAGCATEDSAQAFRMGESEVSLPFGSSSAGDVGTTGDSGTTGWSTTGDVGTTGWSTTGVAGTSGDETDETGETGETGELDDDFVDPWEPGELWLDDFEWLSEDEGSDSGGTDTGGTDTGGTDTGGTDTGGTETGGTETGGAAPPPPPPECAAGEFTIIVLVKLKYGVDGNVTFAHGTLTKIGEETEGGVVNKEYLACIPADKILGPMAPGVRITAAVVGTNAADRVVGMRRGIDRNWIGKCTGDPAKSCYIDAKFNANGTNTLPIAVAVVVVEFARIETAPPPREVIP